MRAVLDTSILIATDVAPIEGELAISAVSLAELHFGVLVARSDDVRGERLRRVGEIERRFASLPVDDQVARAYGRIAAATVAHGRSPRQRSLDLLIAATAIVHDARLITRNPADFAGLETHVDIVTA